MCREIQMNEGNLCLVSFGVDRHWNVVNTMINCPQVLQEVKLIVYDLSPQGRLLWGSTPYDSSINGYNMMKYGKIVQTVKIGWLGPMGRGDGPSGRATFIPLVFCYSGRTKCYQTQMLHGIFTYIYPKNHPVTVNIPAPWVRIWDTF